MPDGPDDLGPLEQRANLALRGSVSQVRIVEDVVERPSEPVLPDHVRRETLLRLPTAEQVAEDAREPTHARDCILSGVSGSEGSSRFAERVLHGVDDAGQRQELVIWIERRPGALWAVGRAIDPRARVVQAPRPDDYVFVGHELGDALEAANAALADDLAVSEGEGVHEAVAPFEQDELLKPLERWFFGHG